ncbi:hypothetical protein AB9T88_16060, partial [Flavobacterium sp. LBUM151]
SYEVDFDTFSELVNKIFKNHKLERTLKSSTDDLPDSYVNPDYMNFSNSKEKDKDKKTSDKKEEEKPKPQNNQGYIPDDNDY